MIVHCISSLISYCPGFRYCHCVEASVFDSPSASSVEAIQRQSKSPPLAPVTIDALSNGKEREQVVLVSAETISPSRWTRNSLELGD